MNGPFGLLCILMGAFQIAQKYLAGAETEIVEDSSVLGPPVVLAGRAQVWFPPLVQDPY